MWGCKKDENGNKVFSEEAYVIGVDPCMSNGYVLFLSKSKDTVLTYNLPPDFAKRIDEKWTGPLGDGYLFPQKFKGEFKIKISYHFANENEFVYPVCKANIYTGGISKVKKQIVINF